MKGGAFIERGIGFWRALNRRERRLVGSGVIVLALSAIWFLMFEPAWQGRERLRAELPRLREQVAKMSALAAEAETLSQIREQERSLAMIREALQLSLGAAGLDTLASIDAGSDIMKVKIDQAKFDAVLTWLYGTVRDLKLRAVDVSVVRGTQAGLVSATISLESPGAAR